MLPPGESAESIEIIRENEVVLEGTYLLYPKAGCRHNIQENCGYISKNEAVYRMNGNYPASASGHLLTQYLNGFRFCFVDLYTGELQSCHRKNFLLSDVTVRIKTRSDARSATSLKNLPTSKDALNRVRALPRIRNDECLSCCIQKNHRLPDPHHHALCI